MKGRPASRAARAGLHASLVVAAAVAGFTGSAQAEPGTVVSGGAKTKMQKRGRMVAPFPNEIALAGFPRFHEARWAHLRPMVVTMSDVEAVFGKTKPESVGDSLQYSYEVGDGLTMIVRYAGEVSEIRRGKYPRFLGEDGTLRPDLYFKVYDLQFRFREPRPLPAATQFPPPFRFAEHMNAAARPLSMSAFAWDSDGLSYGMTKIWDSLSSTSSLPTPLPLPTRVTVNSVTYGLSDAVRQEYGIP